MKKYLFFIIPACLAIAVFAQEEKPSFSITRIETHILTQRPEDVPYMLSRQFSGYYFTYLITGSNIGHIKKDSLVITKLQMKDGTDISKTPFDERPTYGLELHPYLFEPDTKGKYARFGIHVAHNKVNTEEVPVIEGFITFRAASGKETETLTIETDDTKFHIVGAYKVNARQTNYAFDRFSISVQGPEEGLAAVEVLADGQPLKSNSKGHQEKGPHQEAIFSLGFDAKPASEYITINLVLWKDLKEHTMPLHPMNPRRRTPNF